MSHLIRSGFVAAFLLLAIPALADESATAIIATPIGDAMVVEGDDGKAHVEYDLLVTSAFDGPVTLESVEVIDAGGNVVGRLEGDALDAATQTILTAQPVSPIPPSGAVALEIDLILPPGSMPRTLGHRITYAIKKDDPTAAMLASRVVEGPEVRVDARPAVAILSPLSGPGWASLNGCCTPNAHRSLRVGSNTRVAKSELFAIDWIAVKDRRFYDGDGVRNEDFPYFGAGIRSVAAGEVVALKDGVAESLPFKPVTTVKGPDDYGGNYLMIRIAPEVYAFYAHLQAGSLTVKVGDKVAAGQALAKLGNTGNSTAPHLHFGLLDRPNFLVGTSLPFVIADFDVTGRVTGGKQPFLTVEPQARQVALGYPLAGSIVTFK